MRSGQQRQATDHFGRAARASGHLGITALFGLLFAAPLSASSVLPHSEELAPGVHAVGFADRYWCANCGWVVLGDSTLLVDLPRGVEVTAYLAEATRATRKPARKLVLTQLQRGDARLVKALLGCGITHVLTSTTIRDRLLAEPEKLPPEAVEALGLRTGVGDDKVRADFLPLDGAVKSGGAAVYLPDARVLFAGPFAVHGPRAPLPDTDTAAWVATLRQLEKLGAGRVVPGRGTWGGTEVLTRQRRFLAELRRQVGHAVAQGRSLASLRDEVRIPADYFVWTPYGNPVAEDLAHVYAELTIPAAPFNGHPPRKWDTRPHALVLIGDQPHEPGYIEEGLRPVFEAAGVVPHFTVDVRALSAENLLHVGLLVMLRDGLQRPTASAKTDYVWMKPEQERAVVLFVEGGGGFLNLHNSLGLYPADGPYLKLLGGRFTTHGPLERFRVEVIDRRHPVTRGVRDFSVADEQHMPIPDRKKVHLLLQSRSDEGRVEAAGWVREAGRGRLCHLANGHTREALLHPMFQRLLRNAMRWCLRREEAGD